MLWWVMGNCNNNFNQYLNILSKNDIQKLYSILNNIYFSYTISKLFYSCSKHNSILLDLDIT